MVPGDGVGPELMTAVKEVFKVWKTCLLFGFFLHLIILAFPPILVSKHPYFRALFTLIPNAPLACPLGRGCSCGI